MGCYICNGSHFARECPNKTCHKCGERGHIAKNCTKTSNENEKCYKCGSEDHSVRECPELVDSMCKICTEKASNHFLDKCCHLCICEDCAKLLQQSSPTADCPICRDNSRVRRIYFG